MSSNVWCDALQIEPPRLDVCVQRRNVSPLEVAALALLERGAPMSREALVSRVAAILKRPADQVARSLTRRRLSLPPLIDEDGAYLPDLYHDSMTDLVSRFDLWEVYKSVPRPTSQMPEHRGPEEPLTREELALAFRRAILTSWEPSRVALAVLDAYQRPMAPREVLDALAALEAHHDLEATREFFSRSNRSIRTLEDGRWAVKSPDAPTLVSMRVAVRKKARRPKGGPTERPEASWVQKLTQAALARRRAWGERLAAMSRALLFAHPIEAPRVVVLVDPDAGSLLTYRGDELAYLKWRAAAYESLIGVQIRALMRSLDIELGVRRVLDLSPPNEIRLAGLREASVSDRLSALVRMNCGLTVSLSSSAERDALLRDHGEEALVDRLAADARALYALYEFGRTVHYLHTRATSNDPKPHAWWVHQAEPGVFELTQTAFREGDLVEVILDTPPPLEDPWSNALRCHPVRGGDPFAYLTDESGRRLGRGRVQRARIAPRSAPPEVPDALPAGRVVAFPGRSR